MADSKISGLTAVAAWATTQEFPVNDSGTSKKITGAQIAAAFPQGTLGYAQVTANQAGITTAADLTGLTLTVTAGTGRRLRVRGYGLVSSSVAGDTIQLLIMEGASQLQVGLQTPSGTNFATVIVEAIVTPSAGSHTYKLQASRQQGTGTITLSASPTIPAFILVEDIGV